MVQQLNITLSPLHLMAQSILLGIWEEAETNYRRALGLWRQLENASGIADVLHNVSDLERKRENLILAEQVGRESLEIRRATNNLWGVAFSLNNLGNIARDLGD